MSPIQLVAVRPSEIEHEKQYLAKLQNPYGEESHWEVVKGWRMNNGMVKFIGAMHYPEQAILYLFEIVEVEIPLSGRFGK